MNEAIQQQWFITHAETGPGNPDGFFCPDCFKEHCETTPGFLAGTISMINPEDSPFYECNSCRKDYRDEK